MHRRSHGAFSEGQGSTQEEVDEWEPRCPQGQEGPKLELVG